MNILKLAALTIGAVVVSSSLALAGNGGIQINQQGNIDINKGGILKLAMVASCDVSGSPSEFPNDIFLTNKGAGQLSAGTKIQWSVPGYGSGYSGTYVLVAALNPGKGVFLSNVLPNGVEAGHDCKAKAY
jgi:hypothetical protein